MLPPIENFTNVKVLVPQIDRAGMAIRERPSFCHSMEKRGCGEEKNSIGQPQPDHISGDAPLRFVGIKFIHLMLSDGRAVKNVRMDRFCINQSHPISVAQYPIAWSLHSDELTPCLTATIGYLGNNNSVQSADLHKDLFEHPAICF